MSLGAILRKLRWKQHILKNENEGKNVLILLFSGNFSYPYWFLCNLLLYLPLATNIWWVSVIFNFIWPVLTDIGLIFKFLIISPWKITFCRKYILSDTFSRGYPVWKCELWLNLSNKTQKHNSAGCDHELHIVGEQPTDYVTLLSPGFSRQPGATPPENIAGLLGITQGLSRRPQ